LSARGRLLAAAAPALAALLALSGCGSSPSGTSASPASVVPATAPLYIDAVVQPSGTLKTNAQSVGQKLTGRSQPFTGLLALLGGPAGKTPDYAHEVKPWLGPEAGVFLSPSAAGGTRSAAAAAQQLLQEALAKALGEGLAGAEGALLGSAGLPRLLSQHQVAGALVLDTSDVDKARSFLDGQAHAAGAHAVTYRGVTFQVAPSGIAEGIVHRFAVIGSEAGLQGVIDTAAGSSALAHASAYTKLTASAGAGRLANVYLDPQALAGAARASATGSSLLGLLRGLLGAGGQLYASLIPSPTSLTLDVDALPGAQSGSAPGPTGAQVLSNLPGTAWLAVGLGDLGHTLGGGTQGLRTLGGLLATIKIGSFSIAKLFAPLSSPSIDLQRDLLSWMGATGVYVAGANLLNLQAAVIVESKDPARSRAAVDKLAQAYRAAGAAVSSTSIPGADAAITVKVSEFPLPLTIADGQNKFVVGLGQSSIEEALSPQSTLAGSALYSSATSALGGVQPSAAIEFATLSGLIESLGLNQAPGFSNIAAALGKLNSLYAGTGQSLEGGVKRARVVLGLK
jgi:hypothetical protein